MRIKIEEFSYKDGTSSLIVKAEEGMVTSETCETMPSTNNLLKIINRRVNECISRVELKVVCTAEDPTGPQGPACDIG